MLIKQLIKIYKKEEGFLFLLIKFRDGTDTNKSTASNQIKNPITLAYVQIKWFFFPNHVDRSMFSGGQVFQLGN